MEARLTEKLRNLSNSRRQFLTYLQTYIPLQHLDNNITFHGLLIFISLVIIIAVFRTTHKLTLFSFHPLCMILGTAIFLAEGIVVYKNTFLLESFSPIMQHTKRMKVRAIHQILQMTGGVLIGLGLLFIFAEKIEIHHTILPHTFHSITATVVLIAVVVQVVVGNQKYQFTQLLMQHSNSSRARIKRWHGDFGLLVWDALCFTLFTGLMGFLRFSFTSLIVCILPFVLWLAVAVQMNGKNAMKDDTLIGSEDDTNDDATSLMMAENYANNSSNTGKNKDISFADLSQFVHVVGKDSPPDHGALGMDLDDPNHV